VAELISVILTTYNREDALAAVLRSLSQQHDRQFEVVIADDGSGVATASTIAEWTSRLGVPLAHVWHEHQNFRAGEIRNRAILASQGWYCVFLDGDCLVRPDFISTHRRLAESGWFVTGNRVLLTVELTAAVLRDGVAVENWGLDTWIVQRRGINRLGPALRLPLGPLRKLRTQVWEGARSCNLAIWRADLDRVDGFDASYSGWGREDSDLLVRLIRSGVRRKDGVFATGVLHLWHADAPRTGLEENERRLAAAIASDRIAAMRGMSMLRAAAPRTAIMPRDPVERAAPATIRMQE
jgi:glycosyltransferase involved in cell wall biosynthesis